MRAWTYLGLAIVAEVIATSALNASAGFSRAGPSAVVVIGYGIASYFLSLTRHQSRTDQAATNVRPCSQCSSRTGMP